MTNVLSVKNVGISFGGIAALQAVNFEVKRHSITSLIGPNGAGKTTLFNCITGFYRPTQGEIILHTDHKALNIGHLLTIPLVGGTHKVAQAGIARTFQNIRLFNEMTVLENLLVAQHRIMPRNLITAIIRTKAYRQRQSDLIEKARFWLDTVGLLDDEQRLANQLPYGHQRRLEIARAMCTSPQLICLDEPAAGLNPMETVELAHLIKQLRDTHKITVLLIEHDMKLVMSLSEHIVVLNYGAVIAQGQASEIQQDPKVIEAYLGSPAKESNT